MWMDLCTFSATYVLTFLESTLSIRGGSKDMADRLFLPYSSVKFPNCGWSLRKSEFEQISRLSGPGFSEIKIYFRFLRQARSLVPCSIQVFFWSTSLLYHLTLLGNVCIFFSQPFSWRRPNYNGHSKDAGNEPYATKCRWGRPSITFLLDEGIRKT